MKVLLMTLNSKYIHSNLAVRYIKRYWDQHNTCQTVDVILEEYTINNQMDHVLKLIYKGDYDIIVASTYIWNIEPLSLLFSDFRKINQKTKIFCGGPEVDADPYQTLSHYEFMDGILVGEGEMIFTNLIDALVNQEDLSTVKGLAYRKENDIIVNEKEALIEPLDQIVFPYESLDDLDHRIVYYESSRGCPYRCTYCLSSAKEGVRELSVERVKKDLDFFINRNVEQVKFIDRTFNLNKAHALPILKHCIERDNGITNFHFEITGTLLDEDYFSLLAHAREGLFQFEIGVQTTFEETMFAIQRPMKIDQLFSNINKLLQMNNIHIHLDLIAGLPYETYDRFLRSFDDVFKLSPHQLQLGFLKILKGTKMSYQIEEHGYKVRNEAPYEVLCNQYITAEELFELKDIETTFEHYYNSGKFIYTLPYMMKQMALEPHDFFRQLSEYLRAENVLELSLQSYRLYTLLFDFYKLHAKGDLELLRDLLKFDYYRAHLKGQRDLFYYPDYPRFNQMRFEFVKDHLESDVCFEGYRQATVKQVLKTTEFITLRYDIIGLIHTQYQSVKEGFNVVMFDYEVGPHRLEPSKYYQLYLDEEERLLHAEDSYTS